MRWKDYGRILVCMVMVWSAAVLDASAADRSFFLEMPSPYADSPIPDYAELDRIRRGAEKGDPKSQLYMGHFYFNGDIGLPDMPQAAEWYRRAAENGNARAQYCLGLLYELGIGVRRDYGEAFRWYMAAAEQNDPAAHLGIAGFHFAARKMYLPIQFGGYDEWRAKAIVLSGVIQATPSYEELFWHDYHSREPFYQNDKILINEIVTSGGLDDGEDLLSLAQLLLHAQGVSRSRDLAVDLVYRAAEKNNPNALFILGAVYKNNYLITVPEDKNQRKEYLRRAAVISPDPNHKAIYHHYTLLGPRVDGVKPLEMNVVRSHQAGLLALAENGNVAAQYFLALSLRRDTGDDAQAFPWFETAGDNGLNGAQAAAGVMLLYGLGVTPDFEIGKEWLDRSLASQSGNILGYLQQLKYADQKKPEKTQKIISWMTAEFSKGAESTALYIGILLDGKDEHKKQSFEWFKKALEANIHISAFPLERMLKNDPDLDFSLPLKKTDFNAEKENCIEDASYAHLLNLFEYSANSGYGPAILRIYGRMNNYDSSCRALSDKWLFKLIQCERWYEINIPLGPDLPYIVSRQLARQKVFSINKNNLDSIPTHDKLNLMYSFME